MMNIDVVGGSPGGRPKPKTRTARPVRPHNPRPIPPVRTPKRIAKITTAPWSRIPVVSIRPPWFQASWHYGAGPGKHPLSNLAPTPLKGVTRSSSRSDTERSERERSERGRSERWRSLRGVPAGPDSAPRVKGRAQRSPEDRRPLTARLDVLGQARLSNRCRQLDLSCVGNHIAHADREACLPHQAAPHRELKTKGVHHDEQLPTRRGHLR